MPEDPRYTHAGKVLASDTPAALQATRNASSLEEAFIAYIRDAIGEGMAADGVHPAAGGGSRADYTVTGRRAARLFGMVNLRRLYAYAVREMLEVMRDRVRLAFAFVGTLLLMLIFGYGITMVWDNRCLLHKAEAYDVANEPRIIRRCTVLGDAPY